MSAFPKVTRARVLSAPPKLERNMQIIYVDINILLTLCLGTLMLSSCSRRSNHEHCRSTALLVRVNYFNNLSSRPHKIEKTRSEKVHATRASLEQPSHYSFTHFFLSVFTCKQKINNGRNRILRNLI